MRHVLELKVAALLWRSPFAAADPVGEPQRSRDLHAWLERQGISLTDQERHFLAECAAEAQDAGLGASAPEPHAEPPSRATTLPKLRHPLTAGQIDIPVEIARADLDPREALERLSLPERTEDLASWYRLLWRQLMREPSFRYLPADARLPDHSVGAHRSMTAALVGARHGGGQPAFLALHVAPVQSFIAAARRTSDLFVGSYTVGALAFTGAVHLAKELGPDVLLNPDVSDRALADRLLFGDSPSGGGRAALLRAALMNRVLAVVPAEQVDRLAQGMAGAVSEAWQHMGREAAHACQLDYGRAFQEQLAHHLEIDQVALPWPKDRRELRSLLAEVIDVTRLPGWVDEEPSTVRVSSAFGLLAELAERTLEAHRASGPPPAWSGDHRPKCTNCGQREQLGELSARPSEQQRRSRQEQEALAERLQKRRGVSDDQLPRASLQLTRGEGLCAVCMTKRLAAEAYYGGPCSPLEMSWDDPEDRVLLRFPSTATIASAPFRFALLNARDDSDAVRQELEAWCTAIETLHGGDMLDFTPPGNLLEGLGELRRGDPLLEQEGTWLYEMSYVPQSAWRNHFNQDPGDEEQRKRFARLAGPLRSASEALRALQRHTGTRASEYYAVIVLDGDEMGKWKAGSHPRSPSYRELGADPSLPSDRRPVHPALYTELSRRLALLNQDLHCTVAKYLGRLIYHGGDDVLALVPLIAAMPCLEAIRDVIRASKHLGDRVTVSAGVAIGHWKTPLSGALQAAREAEQEAKRAGRDRFHVTLSPRSGEQLSLTLPWTLATGGAQRRPQAVLETLPLVHRLLRLAARGPVDDAESFSAGKAAHALRAELPALRDDGLREAFLHRARRLLGDEVPGTDWQVLVALFDVLKPQGIIDLLLLLRFLARQQNGIDPDVLFAEVEKRAEKRGAYQGGAA